MKPFRAHLVSALFLALALAGCGGDSGTNPDPDPEPTGTTGSLAVTVQGLPSGASAVIAVAGPGGYTHAISGTETLSGLAPGAYSVTISDVTADGLVYGSDQNLRYATVTAGATAAVTVGYRGFNLSVENFYITQSIQKYDGSIPLVAGRDGVLRVFAKANNANTVQAPVRVRFYQNGEPKGSMTIDAPSFAAPTAISEGSLGTSWNLRVPGSMIQPGLAVAVDIDPDGAIAETEEADNHFPAGTTPRALQVERVPTLDMVLVPVRQGNGTVGNVTEANKDAYVADLLRMFPIADYRVSVRAPYVTTTTLKGATAADDGGRSWETLLSEIESVRVGDGRTGQYYFGVGKIDYEAGIYGIAFRPGKSGLGNDYLDNRNLNASMTLAHETGHSMGRPHSQCGSVAGPDVSYPYPNGQIGSYGMDVATERLYGPDTKDLMGYCEDRWIGDYTYQKVLEHRLTVEDTLSRGSPPATVEPSLVVWGRMDDSGLTLEPAYEVETRPYLPAAPGPYTLEGLDASGARIFSISFAGGATDAPGGGRIFAYALPAAMAQPGRLAALRLSGAGRQVVRRGGGTPGAPALAALDRSGLRARRVEGGRVRLDWNAATHPLVVLRDPETHAIVSLVRGGTATLRLPALPLEAIVSDGVHSVSGRIDP